MLDYARVTRLGYVTRQPELGLPWAALNKNCYTEEQRTEPAFL